MDAPEPGLPDAAERQGRHQHEAHHRVDRGGPGCAGPRGDHGPPRSPRRSTPPARTTLALASRIAFLRLATRRTVIVGPNVSSRTAAASSGTSVRMTGRTYRRRWRPGHRAGSGRPPRATRVGQVPPDDVDLRRHRHRAVGRVARRCPAAGPPPARSAWPGTSRTPVGHVDRSMPMQVWPALVSPPQAAASAAAFRSASGVHDQRVLAAALGETGVRTGRGRRHHLARGGGRAGERDLVHPGRGQRTPGPPVAGERAAAPAALRPRSGRTTGPAIRRPPA